MKKIEPDSIPELTFFPYFVAAFTVLALIFAFIDNKWLYLLWFTLFSLALCAALYDFYLWEYDYGHNLAPNAPMKFEGESFQPPLFGSKDVINFVAKSYPHIGGYLIGISILFSGLAGYLKFKKSSS